MSAIAATTSTRWVPNLLTLLLQRLFGQGSSAKPITREDQAEELREWASWHVRHHRGFQDDLYAAADRHERGG